MTKMNITFTDLAFDEGRALIEFAEEQLVLAIQVGYQGTPKRKRRTKAEIEEAARVEAEAVEENKLVVAHEASEKEDEKPARRRKQRGAKAAPAGQPTRRKGRGRKKAEEGEISDIDVLKAASDAAQELTPKAVREIIDQFGVGNVAELDQGQRQNFISLLDAAIADDGIPF